MIPAVPTEQTRYNCEACVIGGESGEIRIPFSDSVSDGDHGVNSADSGWFLAMVKVNIILPWLADSLRECQDSYSVMNLATPGFSPPRWLLKQVARPSRCTLKTPSLTLPISLIMRWSMQMIVALSVSKRLLISLRILVLANTVRRLSYSKPSSMSW